MSTASVEFEVDDYLHMASTKALIKEMTHRQDARDIVSEIEDEVISFVDDNDLINEIEDRGFKVSKNKDGDDWFEVTYRDWNELASIIARHETRDALELLQYLSNGTINAICALNRPYSFYKSRTSL